jgi:fructan beta-fructosidase
LRVLQLIESRHPADVRFWLKAVFCRFANVSFPIVLLALSQINGSAASVDLLAYEGFNYSAGSAIAGKTGGEGWSNSWVDVSGNVGETAASGLVANTNAPIGYDNRSVGNAVLVSNGSRCGRWLDCSPIGVFAEAGLLDANGNIGANGKTLYISFLQQPNSAIQFYEFEIHRNDLGDPGRVAGIGNDVPNSTQVHLRAPAGTHTPLGIGNTNVNFYIMRIDYKSGNDDVYVYRNPTGNLESDNEPVLTMLSVADMSFDGISIGAYLNGVAVKTDELRIGQTWASVLGDPPVFVLQPTNKSLYAGEVFTLNSLAQSSLPLSYRWYRIAGGLTNALPNATNSNLSFSAVQFDDAGQYFVTASNGLGIAISSIASVAVQPIIVAVTSAANVPIGIGSNLVINAIVSGAAPIMLQWYRDGQPVPGANSATLALTATTAFDVGQYVLVASNSYGGVTSSIVNAFPNTGGLLACEGFDYGQSGSDIGGRNGGFGWAGSWQNLDGGSSESFSNNLSPGASAPSGYDARSSGGSLAIVNNSRKGRFLDCSATGNFALYGYINANGDIGADGKSLYLSFLQQPNGTSLFYEFELHRKDLGDGGRMGGIGNDTGNSDANLRVEVPPGGASTFWSLGPGNTGVNFYVVRVDFKPGNDDVFVYRNPTSLTEPTTPTLVVSNVADMSFDGISFGAYLNSRSVSHDEIRLGATWADVLGIANPSRLRLAQRANNSSHLLLAGAPNFTYQVQATSNIAGPWTNIGTVPLSSLGTGQFAETNPSNWRFYRATNSLAWTMPPSAELIIADFEQPNYGAWVATGTAFGSGPAQGTLPNQQTVSGYQGSGLVNTYYGGDTSTGTLTSPPFVITKPFINFLIGGGGIPGQECMNLIISNVVVKTATGANNEALVPQQWDVSAYLGQTAILQIVDSATGSWGHINVDQITLSEIPLPSQTRDMLITNNLLNLPVQNSAFMRRVTVTVGGIPVRDFNIRLSTGGTADWWAFVDVSAFTNEAATLSVSSVASVNDGFYSITQTNGIIDGTNLYQETLRPQFHFSTKRGWLNDANGMVYHNGKYHLYYQHDPFDWGGAGQKWWGHAISTDMVNWVEIQEGLYSHSYGDQVYSGSAVVDTNNTGGFKTGTNDVIVAAFTSTARGECIVYSNDGGLTFAEITNNPVVAHSGRDPHLFWYAPSNYWVMALYDASGGDGIAFYSSPNLRQWTYCSKINRYFECPDIFQLPVDGNTNNMIWLLCDASSGYQLGQFNGVTFTPSTSKLPGNSGNGFYASQTFTSMPPGDKRLVRTGWAQISTPGMPFNQSMYFPTELTLRTLPEGVRLCSQPVAELANLSINDYAWTNLTLSAGSNPLSGIRGSLFNLHATFAPGTAQTINFSFQVVSVVYNVAAQQITCNGKTNSLAPSGGVVQLQILVDRDTVEIFANDGQLYMPLPANNSSGNSLVSVTCSGGSATFNSLVVSKLKSIWRRP